MQRKLGRLAHGTNEQANGSNGDNRPSEAWHRRRRQRIQPQKDLRVVERAGVGNDQSDPQNEAQIGHAVDQESLLVGCDSARLIKPETDQQIGGHPYAFPADEKLQQVVAHDQHEHGKREQGQVGKEAAIPRIAMHVAGGIKVHHE